MGHRVDAHRRAPGQLPVLALALTVTLTMTVAFTLVTAPT